MKSLKDFIKEQGSGDIPGMGSTTYPDVAGTASDVMSPEYKHGSGDIPGTVKKKDDEDFSGHLFPAYSKAISDALKNGKKSKK